MNSQNILVIAPHPDDETLGCGGTLLKYKDKNARLHWLIITEVSEEDGFSAQRVQSRNEEIEMVVERYGFDSVHQLGLPTARLDTIPMGEMVQAIGRVFHDVQPDTIFLPYRGDIHSDHAVVFDAVSSCTKWFRYPFIKNVLVYETLSETDFGINPDNNGFHPNVFSNISDWLREKVDIMEIFKSEMGLFPFPRSSEAIESLAKVRGAASGYHAAEAFMLLKESWD